MTRLLGNARTHLSSLHSVQLQPLSKGAVTICSCVGSTPWRSALLTMLRQNTEPRKPPVNHADLVPRSTKAPSLARMPPLCLAATSKSKLQIDDCSAHRHVNTTTQSAVSELRHYHFSQDNHHQISHHAMNLRGVPARSAPALPFIFLRSAAAVTASDRQPCVSPAH